MAELDEESCIDLFENITKTDGGPVEKAILSEDKCSITIVFEKTEGKHLKQIQYRLYSI